MLFFDLSDEVFDNGYDITPSFTGNPMGFLHNSSGLVRQVRFIGNRLFQFLILPAQKPRGKFFFLLSDKTHYVPSSIEPVAGGADPQIA